MCTEAYSPAYLTRSREEKSLQRGFDRALQEINGACLLARCFPWLSMRKLRAKLHHSQKKESSRGEARCTVSKPAVLWPPAPAWREDAQRPVRKNQHCPAFCWQRRHAALVAAVEPAGGRAVKEHRGLSPNMICLENILFRVLPSSQHLLAGAEHSTSRTPATIRHSPSDEAAGAEPGDCLGCANQEQNKTSVRSAKAGFAALVPVCKEMHWNIYQKLQVWKL